MRGVVGISKTNSHSPSLPAWDLCSWDSNPLFALRTGMPHAAPRISGLAIEAPNLFLLACQECCHKSQPHQERSALAPSHTEMGEPKRKMEQTENTEFQAEIRKPQNTELGRKNGKCRISHFRFSHKNKGSPHFQGTGRTYRSSPPVRWQGPEAELRWKVQKPPQTTFTGGGGRVHKRAELT